MMSCKIAFFRNLSYRDQIFGRFIPTRSVSTSKYICSEQDESNNNNNSKSNQESTEQSSEQEKKNEALSKLQDMLRSMKKSTDFSTSSSKIEVPKPRMIARAKHYEEVEKRKQKEEEEQKNDIGNKLADAASEVAKTIGGDVQQTEKELLEIYLSPKSKPEEPSSQEIPEAEEKALPKEEQSKNINLSDLISGMKIDTSSADTTIPVEQTRAFQVRKILSQKLGKEEEMKAFLMTRRQRRGPSAHEGERINIFGAEPLGIFNKKELDEKGIQPPVLQTWDAMVLRELRLCVAHPPNNILEQMIQWTEQGKLWKFPIDNEQDIPEEQKVDFTDHVFLEKHLEPWCPTYGPVREFMELVCIGLSKNPYLTVAEKKEHIYFYEDYFRRKNDLLHDTGCPTILDRQPGDVPEMVPENPFVDAPLDLPPQIRIKYKARKKRLALKAEQEKQRQYALSSSSIASTSLDK